MKSFRLTNLILTFFVCFTSGIASSSVLVPIGAGPIALLGTSSAAEPELAGIVLLDKLIPFSISNAAGDLLFKGELQNRVIKSSSTGLLHFYYSIRKTQEDLNGIVQSVSTKSFALGGTVHADWRVDGLGDVSPIEVSRSGGTGELIRFRFSTAGSALTGGLESNFFFLKTKSFRYKRDGQTRIQLRTGESVVLSTASPAR
jgi:hypothetical protein